MYRVSFGAFYVGGFSCIYYYLIILSNNVIQSIIKQAIITQNISIPIIGSYICIKIYFYLIKSKKQMDQESQHQNIIKISKPFTNINQFLNKYKPLSKCIDINKLKINKMVRFAQDEGSGYYYGEINTKGKNGIGVLFYYNGSIYEGQWLSDNKNGNGFEKNIQGWNYNGTYKNGKYQGKGTMTFQNGDSFNGQWLKGEKSGYGIWKSGKGFHYVGQWKKDEMHGYGVMTESNGNKFEGFFKNGEKSGKGVYKYFNGDIYKGYFLEGLSHGFGQYYWKNGNRYKGEYKMGKRQGPGQLKQVFPQQKTYQGYFKDDMKWGYGVCTWISGSVYKGFFQRDRFHGYGEMFWPDGNIYRGWWSNNLQNGKGQLFVQSQGLMKGIFNNNRLVLLTEKEMISKKQYDSSLIKKITPANNKLINKTSLQKSKKKLIFYEHRRLKTESLDTIQFPLLFHKQSRRKNEQIEIKLYEQNRNSSRKRFHTLQLQNSRSKKLHSSFSIYENFMQSNKNSDSTIVSSKMPQPSWNKKLSMLLKDRKIEKVFDF